LANVDRF